MAHTAAAAFPTSIGPFIRKKRKTEPMSDANQTPSPTLTDTATLVAAWALFAALGVFAAGLFVRITVDQSGLERAREIGMPITLVSVVVLQMVGGVASLGFMRAGRKTWAVAFSSIVAVAGGAVVAVVMAELGAGAGEVFSQTVWLPLILLFFQALAFLVEQSIRALAVGTLAPMFRLLSDLFTALETKTPWGPRWGRAVAILAAVWMVFVAFAMLLAGSPIP